MEENRYYVPGIDEFFVGFRYEYYNNFSKRWIETVLEEEDYRQTETCGYINDETCPFSDVAKLRVKRLGKQDLIELGFEEIGQEEYYLNGDLNSWCIEALYHQSIKSYYRIDDGETQRMFLEIKNKSELIKVLKMLGIK